MATHKRKSKSIPIVALPHLQYTVGQANQDTLEAHIEYIAPVPLTHAQYLVRLAQSEKEAAKRATLYLRECARAVKAQEKKDAKVMGAAKQNQRGALPHYELKGVRASMPLPRALVCNRPDLRLDGVNRRPALIGGTVQRLYQTNSLNQITGFIDLVESTGFGATTQSDANYESLTLVRTRNGSTKLAGKSAPRSKSGIERKSTDIAESQTILLKALRVAPSDATLELASRRAQSAPVNNTCQSNKVIALRARSEYLIDLLTDFRARIGAGLGARMQANQAMGLIQRFRKEQLRLIAQTNNA